MTKKVKKIGDLEFTLKPNNASDTAWTFAEWKQIPIYNLNQEDIETMLETCAGQLWRKDVGEVAEGWCNILTHLHANKSNQKNFNIAILGLGISILFGLLSTLKCWQ